MFCKAFIITTSSPISTPNPVSAAPRLLESIVDRTNKDAVMRPIAIANSFSVLALSCSCHAAKPSFTMPSVSFMSLAISVNPPSFLTSSRGFLRLSMNFLILLPIARSIPPSAKFIRFLKSAFFNFSPMLLPSLPTAFASSVPSFANIGESFFRNSHNPPNIVFKPSNAPLNGLRLFLTLSPSCVIPLVSIFPNSPKNPLIFSIAELIESVRNENASPSETPVKLLNTPLILLGIARIKFTRPSTTFLNMLVSLIVSFSLARNSPKLPVTPSRPPPIGSKAETNRNAPPATARTASFTMLSTEKNPLKVFFRLLAVLSPITSFAVKSANFCVIANKSHAVVLGNISENASETGLITLSNALKALRRASISTFLPPRSFHP